MALPVRTFSQFVSSISTALGNGGITDISPGSIALAFTQALSAVSIALQQLMVHIANITRLATSYGSDVDSFLADYGLTRLPPVSSTGTVVLTRSNTAASLPIQLGAIAQTVGNSVQFVLIADTSQPNFSVPLNAYVFNPGDSSITVTVQAITAVGTAGNVVANSITQIVNGFAGVNSLTNPAPFTNGQAAESDAAAKLRFLKFISSLALATENAVEYAIESVQSGLTYQLIESLTFAGSTAPGTFIIVVDDGSGNIPSSTIAAITAAVLLVRAAGISFGVYAPTNVSVTANVAVTAAASYNQAAVEAQVASNITAYINMLGVGGDVSYVQTGVVVQATPGVIEYSGLTINGGTSDIAIANTQLARAGSITVT